MSDAAAIKDFLNKKPSVSDILEFVEREAQRVAAEKKAQKNREVLQDKASRAEKELFMGEILRAGVSKKKRPFPEQETSMCRYGIS